MANHYEIWVTKYGKEEADLREAARCKKLSEASKLNHANRPKKPVIQKEKIKRTGSRNSMYGKTVLEVWIEKYGKETAEQKWKDFCKSRGEKLKEKMNSMTSEERSKLYGNFGDDNPAKRPDVKKLIKEKINAFWQNDELNAECRKKLSEKMKGDNNPSRQPGASERISKQMQDFYSDENNRKKLSDRMCKLHLEGRGGSGYTKYYRYQIENTEYIVQGTYELSFIKWLDMNNMKFRCHADKIPYIDKEGKQHVYLPDFFVEDWNSYVDVKSGYWYNIQKEKFDDIFRSNPNLSLKILLENDLRQLIAVID